MAIINGRRINVPDSGMYGRDLIKEANPGQGRRTVKYGSGLYAETIDPKKKYTKSQLIDKKGNPIKISTIPDRTKGTFGGMRTALSKEIIREQVIDLAEHYFKTGLDFDESNADWMVIPNFYLPRLWHAIATETPLLIVFPREYPEIPPVGFYVKADLPGAPDGHLFPQVYHDACKDPLEEGWKWYCVKIDPGAWRPAIVRRRGDWKWGDNLWTYFTLITETLSTKGE